MTYFGVNLNIEILKKSNDLIHIEKSLLLLDILESVVSLYTYILFGVVSADLFKLNDCSLGIFIKVMTGTFFMSGSCHYSFV
jgi:hypothetical protein